MLFREDVVTRAAPERAWALISDPSLHGQWNPRIVATETADSGPPGLGFRYRVTYELSGRRCEYDAEVVEFSPPTRFVVRLEERFKGDGSNLKRFVIETYETTLRTTGTYVRHEVRVRFAGVNVLMRLMIWLIQRTGRPAGETFMQRFAEIAEEAQARAS
jgi:uncharacterized protein YndB with AHSA1/START domain